MAFWPTFSTGKKKPLDAATIQAELKLLVIHEVAVYSQGIRDMLGLRFSIEARVKVVYRIEDLCFVVAIWTRASEHAELGCEWCFDEAMTIPYIWSVIRPEVFDSLNKVTAEYLKNARPH